MKYFLTSLIILGAFNFLLAQEELRITFTHDLTLEDMVNIKSRIDGLGHSLTYQRIEFDKDGKLKSLDVKIETQDDLTGTAKSDDIDKGATITYVRLTDGSNRMLVDKPKE